MTVHFVVRQVSSGPAGNIKYLMPRPPTTRDSQGSDGSIWDRSSSPWRADWEGARRRIVAGGVRGKEGGREPYLKHVIDASIRCRSVPPRTTFEMLA